MKWPRKHSWSEGANDKTASIMMESHPFGLWLIDQWLWVADETFHFVDRLTGHRVLDRLSKGWGNPICAAYLHAWGNWYGKYRRQELWVDVPFEKLSPDTQAWFREERAKWETEK